MNEASVAQTVILKTRNLSFFDKLLQGYWLNPSSWLLDEIAIMDGNISIVRLNGDRFQAPLAEIDAKYAVDNYGRREMSISSGSKKTRFKEIPGMLSEEEWEQIFCTLKPRKSGLGKINDLLRGARDAIKD